jgi:hypothetical protein
MPYINELDDWRLLRILGMLINQTNSCVTAYEQSNKDLEHDNRPTHSSPTISPDIDDALFAEQLRRIFLPNCLNNFSRVLSVSHFDECKRDLKKVCFSLEEMVHPQVSYYTDFTAHNPRLKDPLCYLGDLKSKSDKVDLANSSPSDPDSVQWRQDPRH